MVDFVTEKQKEGLRVVGNGESSIVEVGFGRAVTTRKVETWKDLLVRRLPYRELVLLPQKSEHGTCGESPIRSQSILVAATGEAADGVKPDGQRGQDLDRMESKRRAP